MLTLSVLAAESQAVLRLGGSRVMVINNTYKKMEKKERERDGRGKEFHCDEYKHVDLDKKGRNEIFMQRRSGRQKRTEKPNKLYLGSIFRACLKPEMSHFSFICFWFQKGKKVRASLF